MRTVQSSQRDFLLCLVSMLTFGILNIGGAHGGRSQDCAAVYKGGYSDKLRSLLQTEAYNVGCAVSLSVG